jgi:siroheme synthase
VVAHGTLAEQQVVCATLGTLADAVASAGLQSPALTIVGEVVKLRAELAWFADAPAAEPEPTPLSTIEA